MQPSRQSAKIHRKGRASDPHGQAALVFAESILHGLIEKELLTIDDALAILAVAMEAKEQIIEQHDEPSAIGRHSLRLLHRISSSLEIDGRDEVSRKSAQNRSEQPNR